MIKNWNADQIIGQLQRIYFATTDPRMDGFVTWDISDGFGFFGKSENHPCDHVGLIRIEDTTKIVIATEQLSYASNTNRFVQAVIGEVAFNKLAMHLRSDSPAVFASREEVLKFLGI